MSRRISISLTEEDAALIERARQALSRPGLEFVVFDQRETFATWLSKLAVRIVATAVIRDRQIWFPPAVDLRPETEAETAARLGRPGADHSGNAWLSE